MALPPPVSRYSVCAAAALEHLRGVEKQVQNEGLVFDKGTVQHLEDTIKAIKELEEERRRLLELLEEETIKNCNLRVRVKEIPEMVMKEFEALVAAARRSRFTKLSEIHITVQEVLSAIEQTCSKQLLSEELNVALWEERKASQSQHEEAIGLLNQHLEAKHSLNIQINELHNTTKDEEEETAWQLQLIDELKKRMALEVSVFTEQQESLESQIAELQRELQARNLKISQKRMDYVSLLATLKENQEQVAEKEQSLVAGKEGLSQLFTQVKGLVKEYKSNKAEKAEIQQKSASLHMTIVDMESRFTVEKTTLLDKLAEAEKKLEADTLVHRKNKSENDLFRQQYEHMLLEEMKLKSRRDQLAKEFERLSNEVTEQLDKVTKRGMEVQGLEVEKERLQDLFDTSETSYMREIQSLELTLQTETDRSIMLQKQLDELAAEYQKLQFTHHDYMDETKEKTEIGHKMHSDLLKQNEELRLEIARSEEKIKTLGDEYRKKDASFKKYNATVTDELEKLEDKYNTAMKLLGEKEEKLNIVFPHSEKLQRKLKETSTSYENIMAIFTGLEGEETAVSRATTHSEREILRLRRLKGYLKGKIDTEREAAKEQLNTFSESLKFLERDYYEMSRKLYIVNGENARFREAIAHLKADISMLENEAELYQQKREQTQMEVRILHGLFGKRWSQDKHLWQLFLKAQHKVLKALEEKIERFKQRNEIVDYVSNGLQLNYEGLASLKKSEPSMELHEPQVVPATPSITA